MLGAPGGRIAPWPNRLGRARHEEGEVEEKKAMIPNARQQFTLLDTNRATNNNKTVLRFVAIGGWIMGADARPTLPLAMWKGKRRRKMVSLSLFFFPSSFIVASLSQHFRPSLRETKLIGRSKEAFLLGTTSFSIFFSRLFPVSLLRRRTFLFSPPLLLALMVARWGRMILAYN